MFSVGLLYLLLEKTIVDQGEASGEGARHARQDIPSQIVFGCQMGLVLLAMIVTRSSVITLQSREGLGSGNLYVGWFTLGKLTG